jgi:RNA 3'-terminal phosphate cyclase (ATP)
LIEIDGSQKSGSGTILRLSVALAAILGEPLHISHIRQNRPRPGLTAARLCDAELQGATINSRELWFQPGKVKGGKIEAEIGTAGSIPMLLMTVLPICAFAEGTVELHVSKGGTDTQHAPTINYLRFTLLPTLQRMGLNANLTIQKFGYYPKGNGEATITVEPCRSLKPLCLESFGNLKAIEGVSVCTFLSDRKVAERQATAANNYLKEKEYNANIQIVNDKSNPLQKGSSIALWAETDTDAILGADAIGELGKTSETVGTEAAEKLHTEITVKPTVDMHLADMLIPFAALAKGKTTYLTRMLSEHLQTNIWLTERMLDVKFNIENIGPLYKIEKAD